ncbi:MULTISPECIES: hypothetical protein [Chryseobacterium]|uniref:hypothetical protein n=1 Tax=Chryseobacterium TaxID=59732 RepID=UPI001297C768|nr:MULTISPECIES: hypothetical protein [Chryseobacterium]MDR6923401.1 hypothetical protein [Chryseobacterium sp. 2987]
MKNIFFILTFLLLYNCTSSIKRNNNISINGECTENLDFKQEYFKKIEIVKDYIKFHKGESKNTYEALKFIGKYSRVSFEDMANYARTYPLGTYEKDYPGWLDWYDKNKCNNIQFKK